jgi:outer membrane protein assembly factor BamB
MRSAPQILSRGTTPLLASAAILISLNLYARGIEWGRFRGPNGAGIANVPGLKIPASEQDFRWKIALPGRGHSSPVIANGRVFVTCTPEDKTKRVLFAAEAATGKKLWAKEWQGSTFRQHADNSFTSSTPAVDAERVYVWWTSPEQSYLVAVDQEKGVELWRKDLGPFQSQHGAGSSPIVHDGTVILDFGQEKQDGTGSFTLCVDAKTGETKWKAERRSTSTTGSTPCIYQPKDGPPQLILIGRTTGITGLDLKTGNTLWEVPDLIPKRCVASPIVTDSGLIIAQCGEGQAESFVYAVRPGAGSAKPMKAYEVIRTGGYVPTPLAVGPLLFLWKENGLVTCLSAENNEQLWSERVEGPFYGSPVAINGMLWNVTRRGDLVILKAGDKHEQIARIPLGEGSFATPAVSDGRVFLRTFTHLIAIGS